MAKKQKANIGLHNLYEPERKRLHIQQKIREGLTAVLQGIMTTVGTLSQPDYKKELAEGMIKVYKEWTPDKSYKLSFEVILTDSSTGTQMLFAPMTLTTLILIQGLDIPPDNLPEFGEWVGKDSLYSVDANKKHTYPGYEHAPVPHCSIQSIPVT